MSNNIIQFNWNTNALFYPLLMAIVFPTRYYFTKQLPSEFNALFLTFIMFTAQISSGIFELIMKCKTKRVHNPTINFYSPNKSKCDWFILILFATSSLDFLSFTICIYIISYSNGNMSFIFRMAQIFFLAMFSKFFLNKS